MNTTNISNTSNKKTRKIKKHNTKNALPTSSNKKTRKIKQNDTIYLLQKSKSSNQLEIPSFITNCKNKQIIGTKTLDIKPRDADNYQEALQVIQGQLKDYKQPIVMKVYKTTSHLLNIELYIYKLFKKHKYEHYVKPICIFSCNDYEDRYNTLVDVEFRNLLIPCSEKSNERFTFIVYTYIGNGDISDFVKINNIQDTTIILNVIQHLLLSVADLVYNVKVIHGDLNSGNILIRKTNQTYKKYTIYGKTYTLDLFGYEPLLIDFGRSYILNDKVPIDNFVINEQISIMLDTIMKYHSNNYKVLTDYLTNINNDLCSFHTLYNETISIIKQIL